MLEQFYEATNNCPPEYENECFAFEGIFGRNRSKYYKAQKMLYFHITQRFKREEQIDSKGKKVKVYSLTGKHIFKPRKNSN